MPSRFTGKGISFQYPDDWELDEDDAPAGCISVTVYSPGGGFWSVALHPRWADPAQLAEAAVEAMRQEYTELEAQQTREALAGLDTIGYDLNFYCLDLTNTARVRCLQTDQTTCTIFYQAEDREFDEIETLFQAMTASLVDGLGRQGDQG